MRTKNGSHYFCIEHKMVHIGMTNGKIVITDRNKIVNKYKKYIKLCRYIYNK